MEQQRNASKGMSCTQAIRTPQAQAQHQQRHAGGDGDEEAFLHAALRHVVPYYRTLTFTTKKRMLNQPLLAVLVREFQLYDESYFRGAIQAGRIRVNGTLTTPEHRLSDNQVVEHTVHIHEPPIHIPSMRPFAESKLSNAEFCRIHIIADIKDASLIAVYKPASVPVHPTGLRYNKNTLLSLLQKQLNVDKLFNVNRLDIVTSGVVVLATTREAAAEIAARLRERVCDKRYVARVRGRFPSTEGKEEGRCGIAGQRDVQQPRQQNNMIDDSFVVWGNFEEGGREHTKPMRAKKRQKRICDALIISAPIVMDRKLSKCTISKTNGREAITAVRFRSYDATRDESIVECKPITGRGHQIRAHLQYVGHPIANDEQYGGSLAKSDRFMAFGGFRMRAACKPPAGVGHHAGCGSVCYSAASTGVALARAHTAPAAVQQILLKCAGQGCAECLRGSYWNDPIERCIGIWLHCSLFSWTAMASEGGKLSAEAATAGGGVRIERRFEAPDPIWACTHTHTPSHTN